MALMLYDFCNFLYFQFRELFSEQIYNYPVDKLSKEVIYGEEEIIWRQPGFSNDVDSEASMESWDDFVQIEGLG